MEERSSRKEEWLGVRPPDAGVEPQSSIRCAPAERARMAEAMLKVAISRQGGISVADADGDVWLLEVTSSDVNYVVDDVADIGLDKYMGRGRLLPRQFEMHMLTDK